MCQVRIYCAQISNRCVHISALRVGFLSVEVVPGGSLSLSESCGPFYEDYRTREAGTCVLARRQQICLAVQHILVTQLFCQPSWKTWYTGIIHHNHITCLALRVPCAEQACYLIQHNAVSCRYSLSFHQSHNGSPMQSRWIKMQQDWKTTCLWPHKIAQVYR